MALAITSLVLGILISAIAVAAGTVIGIAYNVSYPARWRQPADRR